jgi:hypothetical protein
LGEGVGGMEVFTVNVKGLTFLKYICSLTVGEDYVYRCMREEEKLCVCMCVCVCVCNTHIPNIKERHHHLSTF